MKCIISFTMDSNHSSKKKICLSKSQFNRNVSQQLICLDQLTKTNTMVALPVNSTSSSF